MSSIDPVSIASSEARRAICRAASHQIAAQATSASGSHAARSAMPRCAAAPANTAAAEIDTAGNTR